MSNGNRSCLHTDLVPEPGVDETIESLKAPFDDERLDTLLTEVGDELREGSLAGEYDTLGIGAVPMADGELRMLTGVGGMAYQDGILLSPQLMTEHLRVFVRNLQGLSVVIDEAIGRLRPLQDDIGTMLTMIGKETTVQPLALFLQDANSDINASIA